MVEKKKSGSLSGKSHRGVSYAKYGYLFIAPFFIIYGIFQLYPLIYTISFSFQDYYKSNGMWIGPTFAGLKNFAYALSTDRVIGAFENTLIMWVANFIPQILLALLLASWFTNLRLKIKAQGIFKTLVYLPNIITAASISVLFSAMFTYPDGPINTLLVQWNILDEPLNFYRSTTATRGIISFINFFMWYGHTTVILLGAMLGISQSVFESAQIDGANDGQIFRKITMPLIKPILIYTLVTSTIGGLQMFDIPMLLQDGGPNYTTETVTMYIFKQAFSGSNNYGRSAAVSVLLFVVTSILSGIIFVLLRDKDAAALRKRDKEYKKSLKRGGSLNG